MRRVADRLARSNIPLAANEVHYSLAHRDPETNGVLEACRELDVALVAYFPLASGRLAGPPMTPTPAIRCRSPADRWPIRRRKVDTRLRGLAAAAGGRRAALLH